VPRATATLRVEACEPVIEVEDRVGIMFGLEEEAVSETVPENPSIGVRLIVDEPELPAIIVRGSGLADNSKSGPITRTPTETEWVLGGDELVPFTSRL
jgi:hypothetical protein